jgi:hypothetical protein
MCNCRRLVLLVGSAIAIGGCGGSSAQKLGCHQYCLEAGGYGGFVDGRPIAQLLTRRAVVHSDGSVDLKVHCAFPRECTGAINMGYSAGATVPKTLPCENSPAVPGAVHYWWAQSDLVVPARSTVTLGLTLRSCVRALLARRHTLVSSVTTDCEPQWMALSDAGRKQWAPLGGATVVLVQS